MNVPSASSSASRTNLASLRPGETARIVAVDYANNPALVRLMEIGLIPGEQVQMIKQAPLGDPIEIRVMNYDLVLRKQEAAAIQLEAPEP